MDEVVKQMSSGNSEAFCDVVKLYEKKIYSYLYRLCGSREDALDLAQDTFLKAYSNLHRFRTGMDFKPWIYRIAHNNYVNHIKLKKVLVDIDTEDFTDNITPLDIVLGKDRKTAIEGIVNNLPYKFRAVFLLRIIDDLSFREIGSILKISESNARMRYLRVRKKIGELLEGGDLL